MEKRGMSERDAHFAKNGRPKRILALDGGGLRGIVTLGMLEQVEHVLRERHGGERDFRLCEYFDLIAGTSTGAIIASLLALGLSVDDIRDKYMALGESVFEPSWLRQGVLRAKYDKEKLVASLKQELGVERTLGSPDLRTGLLVVAKRVDTGSPWPVINNPNGRYYEGDPDRGVIGNKDYPLWSVVRASTAAPTYFDPESMTIAHRLGAKPVEGTFVDGGVSPHNDPSLIAFMFATLEGCRIGWDTGLERLSVLSLGTGRRAPFADPASTAAAQGVQALGLLMDDCGALVQTMMQWMSRGVTRQHIDGDLGDLAGDVLGGDPQFHYARYDVDLGLQGVRDLEHLGGFSAGDDERVAGLSAMDAPANMQTLWRLGQTAGRRDISGRTFPAVFDLER